MYSTPQNNECPPISIAIIGGGLGGLTLAHYLQHTNFQVTVFEKDENQFSRGQGYYIGLLPEPVQILKSFIPDIPDLSLILSEGGGCPSRFFMADEFLRELISFGGGEQGTKLVNRWGLRECLTQNLKKEIIWGKNFQKYEETQDGVIVYFEDGEKEKFDFVVGSDGAFSSVRSQRCPGVTNNFTGYVNCMGTLDFPENSVEFQEIIKFISKGFLRILGTNGHTYLVFCYQNQKSKKPEILWGLSWPAQPEDEEDIWSSHKKSEHSSSVFQNIDNSELSKKLHLRLIQKTNLYFKHQEITHMILNTPLEKLKGIRKIHSSAPCSTNPLGKTTRVTLLGDAMHPMTTHMGLGANTAILDAKDLAMALIKAGGSLQQGIMDNIGEYETVLVKRGFRAVKGSLMSTGMIHSKGWKAWVRNWLAWTIGKVINSCLWCSSWFSWKKRK